MSSGVPRSIKAQLLEVSRDYLGPAAERFVDRQISTHLRKKPEHVSRQDVNKLADWLRLSFALLTNDVELVDEYTERLKLIADGRPKEALGGSWPK